MEGGRREGQRLGLGSDPLVGWALGPSQKDRELGVCEHKCFQAWRLHQSGLFSWGLPASPAWGQLPKVQNAWAGLGSGFTPTSRGLLAQAHGSWPGTAPPPASLQPTPPLHGPPPLPGLSWCPRQGLALPRGAVPTPRSPTSGSFLLVCLLLQTKLKSQRPRFWSHPGDPGPSEAPLSHGYLGTKWGPRGQGCTFGIQCNNIRDACGERPACQGALFFPEEWLLLPDGAQCLDSADRGTDSSVAQWPANNPAGSHLRSSAPQGVRDGVRRLPRTARHPSPASGLPRPELKWCGSSGQTCKKPRDMSPCA